MGNNIAKKRIINVKNPGGRLSKLERQSLKEAFDRIQDQQFINEYQFRIDVLGPQVPEAIAIKLFQVFSSDETNMEVMSFEDVVSCYIAFKHPKPEELGQLCFEIIKLSTATEYVTKEHLTLFAEKIVQLTDTVVTQYYQKTKFDPRLPIKREEFVTSFVKVQSLPLFTWVPKLIDGFKSEMTNFDDSKGAEMVRRLTIISKERAKFETEKLGFDSAEYDSMQEFFDNEIKKNDAKEVLKTVQKMFKNIKNLKLRKYFIDALTKHKALDFGYMSNMVFFILKERSMDKKIDFLFDLFSNHSDAIKKKQMKEFAEIFDLGINFFISRGGQLSLEEFIEDLQMVTIDFTIYEQTKYIIIAMLGLKAANDEEQRETILAALDNNHNIDTYINDHLDEEDTFYIIEKQFWDSWCANTGFNELKTFSSKAEKPKKIDNIKLIEPLHQLRLQDVVCNEQFVVVPKYVYFPLSKWYPCNKVIPRQVIKYKSSKTKSLSLFKKKQAQSLVPQVLPDGFIKTLLDTNYELELYPKFIYYDRVTDKGEKLHFKAIVNQKIDQSYMKKVLKSDKLPFQELLVSRKSTFEELLKTISVTYKENPKRGRLWIEDRMISGAKLEENLEDFGMSQGQVVYVEFSSVNNQWPSDREVVSTPKTSITEKDKKQEQ